jgi:hypothetical protein
MTVNEKFFQWLDKLESGEIQQGLGSLHRIHSNTNGEEVERMCCLGVCSSMFADDLSITVKREGTGVYYNDKAHYPTKDVLQHMGIPETHIVERSIGWSVDISTPKDIKARIGDDYFDTGRVGVDVLNDNKYTHPEIAALLRAEFAPETVEA